MPSTGDAKIRHHLNELFERWTAAPKKQKKDHMRFFVIETTPAGFDRVDVKADGNCFFRAVARQLPGATPENLREAAVDYICEHPGDFRGFADMSFDDFVREQATSGTWADEPIITALSQALQLHIIVHRTNQAPANDLGMLTPDAREINVLYNGVHYDALIRPEAQSSSARTIRRAGK